MIVIITFIQTGDFHLDCPLGILENTPERRGELLMSISSVMKYVKETGPDFLFLTGDIFDNDLVSEKTLTFLKDHFEALKPVRIFITPGNHDYIGRNSAYTGDFPSNVHIFKAYERVNLNSWLTLTGTAFKGRTEEISLLAGEKLPPADKVNILISHGEIFHGIYNPMKREELQGFTYCGLGHRHVASDEGNIHYSGAPYGRSFKEEGSHYIIQGKIFPDSTYEISRTEIKGRKYHTLNIATSEFKGIHPDSTEAAEIVRERISSEISRGDYIRVKISGYTDTPELLNGETLKNLLPEYQNLITDTEGLSSFDEDELRDPKTLPGRFNLMMRDKIKKAENNHLEEKETFAPSVSCDLMEDREILEQALKYGLAALKGTRIL